MTEYGRVSRLDGDIATVVFERRGECDRCRMCSVAKDGIHVEIKLENTLGINVGDYVKVRVFKKKIRLGSALIYLLPLCLTALCAGLGALASLGASILLGITGLVVGLAFAVPIDVFLIRKKDGYKPVMLEVCGEADYLNNNNPICEKKDSGNTDNTEK